VLFRKLRLAVATGSISVALLLTPKGRSLAAGAWKWITSKFGKKTASYPKEVSVTFERESPKGHKLRIEVSYKEFLAKLPPAMCGGFAPLPDSTAQLALPPQASISQSADSDESLVKPAKVAAQSKDCGRAKCLIRRGHSPKKN